MREDADGSGSQSSARHLSGACQRGGSGSVGRSRLAGQPGAPESRGDNGGVRPAGASDPAQREWRDSPGLISDYLSAYEVDDFRADNDAGDEDADRGRKGDEEGGGPWPLRPPGPGKPGGRAPFPAKINLLVPVGTLLGWSDMPGEAGRDLIDPQTLRDLVQACSHHPATRWCATLIDDADGTAAAHGCAKGQHPWVPPSRPPLPGEGRSRDGASRHYGATTPDHAGLVRAEKISGRRGHDPGSSTGMTGADAGKPGPGQDDGTPESRAGRPRDRMPAAAQLGQLGQLIGGLKAAFEPIARGDCDHRHREDRYRPSRALQDLVRARNATCPAPGCGASSAHCDLDHTTAWPVGETDECNLGTPCRHDHRLKQAPGWDLTQPAPGSFRWTTPAGRTYWTSPTIYDI